MPWRAVLLLTVAGVASLWVTVTAEFRFIDFSWSLILLAIWPTLCSIHLLWLAARKYRRELRDESKVIERTR